MGPSTRKQSLARVTIESSGALKAKHSFVASPPRLVVDIDDLELSPALRELVAKVRPDDPHIAGIRAGPFRGEVMFVLPGLAIVGASLLAGSGGRTDQPGGDIAGDLADVRAFGVRDEQHGSGHEGLSTAATSLSRSESVSGWF